MDPWVVSDVLRPNLESTGFLDVSVIHTIPVENFIERAKQFIGITSELQFSLSFIVTFYILRSKTQTWTIEHVVF